MKLILKYLLKYKKLLVLNVISVFGFALVELGLPTIIANMIDIGVATEDKGYLYMMWGCCHCNINCWSSRNNLTRVLLCENFNINYT